MGNKNLVITINDLAFIVRGIDSRKENDAVGIAVELFKAKAKKEIDYFYEMKEKFSDTVVKDYHPENDWLIKQIFVFDLVD